MQNIKIAITGHVDHGKSTLVGRLMYDTGAIAPDKLEEIEKTCLEQGKDLELAYILDYFREERERGITIDTTQIFFKSEKRHYIIIDTPGHKEFIKNMVTGASQAHAGVLIVDVVEGIMEQTKRHLYILGMIGIKDITVVVNKMNLAEYSEERFNAVKKQLLEFAESIQVKVGDVIPINARDGDNVVEGFSNMPWYTGGTLIEVLDQLELIGEGGDDNLLCMPIQDVYEDAALGKIASGKIVKDQTVDLMTPSGKHKATVVEVKKYNEEPVEAIAGESIGLKLETDGNVSRGAVVTDDESNFKISKTLEARIFWLSQEAFDIQDQLMLKVAACASQCMISKIIQKIDSSNLEEIKGDENKLNHTEVARVEIECSDPVVFSTFDASAETGRFVLEVAGQVVAGGIII